ncbi:MAG: hypothetical protein Q9179_000857 [Wetmoreana sp. 5 TL-2023]
MHHPTRNEIAAIIANVREVIMKRANSTPLSVRQKASLEESSAAGPWCVSQTSLPAPPQEEGDATDVLMRATEMLEQEAKKRSAPSAQDVKAEWLSYREDGGPPGAASEQASYDWISAKTRGQPTIFYIQGGAFVLNSPARFRSTTCKLAELTGGRCFSIHYRLAPQHPFPAALLDVIIAYLSLVHPPPGAYHSPVSPSSIVIAGDSSGACLGLALIQVIIAARQAQATDAPLVRFHGREVNLLMPSGLALQSPWIDQTDSLPSWTSNGRFDVVQEISPLLLPDYPTCPIWPSHPPRGNVYCETEMLSHPLVSPLVARSWTGAPPLWFALGEERMIDAAKVVAQNADQQGVVVQWLEFEAMPHNWPMLFPKFWQSARCMQEWASACSSFAQGNKLQSRAGRVRLDGQSELQGIRTLIRLSMAEVVDCMGSKQASLEPWTGRFPIEKL